jgi:excisionase family DNA binding protein
MTPMTPFEPALVKIEPACQYLGVGRSKIYELIREGKLEAVKIGKSARITTASLKSFVGSLPPSAGGSPIKRKIGRLEKLGLDDEPNPAKCQ